MHESIFAKALSVKHGTHFSSHVEHFADTRFTWDERREVRTM